MQRPVDDGTGPTVTERNSSNGSRKRERDSWEEEPTERRPSKRRHSEEEVTQLEEEEVQTLLEPWEDAVEPLPEISLILRSENGEQLDCVSTAREFPASLTNETCRAGPNK
jgi:hypothetical protein